LNQLTSLSRSVKGRVALITGAGSGIGRATAHLLASEGVSVAVTDIDADAVDSVVNEIQKAGCIASGWTLNVADTTACSTVVTQVAGNFGQLDFLLNNAGLARPAAVDDNDYEKLWSLHLDVMLSAQVRLIRAALPHLQTSDCARIVNIASTEGLGASPRLSPYSTAKHGVIGLTRSLAVEIGSDTLTVNCVCPGAVHTAITRHISDEHKQMFSKARVPLNRFAAPEEIAHPILNLLLPSSCYINGSAVVVDGGLTVKNG